jgi:hypothetical protein
VISGDRVVGRFIYRATHTGELMGIPASGNAVEMRSIDIWRVMDGMFVEHWDELNPPRGVPADRAIPPLDAAPAGARLMSPPTKSGPTTTPTHIDRSH